jgi:NADPH:quinone reductase
LDHTVMISPMRQIQFRHFGGPDVLEVVERPTPRPGPRQALIRVHTAGVNFFETLLRENRYAVTPELPCVPGVEIAGTVAAVGDDVDLRVGARVAVPLFASGSFGGYADHALVDAALAVPLPDTLSFETASALMVQGLTALTLVREIPPRGKTVLVSAAAGGVGSLLVQLAKRAGARQVIAAASSADKLAFTRALGADAGADYTRSDWVDQVRAASGGNGPDIIYESAGGDVTSASLAALAPRGQLVIYGALNIQRFDFGAKELVGVIFKNQSLIGLSVATLLTPETLASGLAELFDLAQRGELTVTIGGSYPLERAADAHRALTARGTMGKLVLTA